MQEKDYKLLAIVNGSIFFFCLLLSFTPLHPIIGIVLAGILFADAIFIVMKKRSLKRVNEAVAARWKIPTTDEVFFPIRPLLIAEVKPNNPAVRICKDALTRLDQLYLNQKIFFRFYHSDNCTGPRSEAVQVLLSNNHPAILVDILGALFLSYIRLFPDKVKSQDIAYVDDTIIGFRYYASLNTIYKYLIDIFSKDQLDFIRLVFSEGSQIRYLLQRPSIFTSNLNDKDTLRIILNNIIEHNGVFCP